MALIYFQKNFFMVVSGGQMDPFKARLSLYLDFVFLCVGKIYHLHPPCPYLFAFGHRLLHHSFPTRWGLFPEESEMTERELQYPYGDILRTPPWRALPCSTMGIFPCAFFMPCPRSSMTNHPCSERGLLLAWILPCTPG